MKTVITIGALMFFLTLSNSGHVEGEDCCPKKVNNWVSQDSLQKRLQILDKKIAIAEKKVNTAVKKKSKKLNHGLQKK